MSRKMEVYIRKKRIKHKYYRLILGIQAYWLYIETRRISVQIRIAGKADILHSDPGKRLVMTISIKEEY